MQNSNKTTKKKTKNTCALFIHFTNCVFVSSSGHSFQNGFAFFFWSSEFNAIMTKLFDLMNLVQLEVEEFGRPRCDQTISNQIHRSFVRATQSSPISIPIFGFRFSM
jgi:hypothetical protein